MYVSNKIKVRPFFFFITLSDIFFFKFKISLCIKICLYLEHLHKYKPFPSKFRNQLTHLSTKPLMPDETK